MTLPLTLLLVGAAVAVWPSPHAASEGDASPDVRDVPIATHPSDPVGAGTDPVGAVSDPTGAVKDPTGDVTVDAAADALVLCALALQSGLGPTEALEAVADHVDGPVARHLRVVASAHRWGQDAATSWAHVGDGWRPAALAWQAAERSGAAPSGVVLAAAGRMRREEASRVEAAVQRAGVLLVLPLGACFLPGFVGTTVVPVVLHLARSTLAGG